MERDMKKYRARWDSKNSDVASWLTDDDHVDSFPEKAAVGSLNETVNRIAQMSLNEPGTVRNGTWVLECRRKDWIAVR